jgi:pSer/pThr/pTyr-binding forkhead associated (FHA) protein
MAEPPNTQALSPAELSQRLDAERRGEPFLVYRGGQGEQRILPLAPERPRVTVGRTAGHDVRLDFDEEVSQLHAVLERLGEHWTVSDDGLSRNGTYLNGARISGRRRLREGDELRFGATPVTYRSPLEESAEPRLLCRDPAGQQWVFALLAERPRVTLGRAQERELQLEDAEVSRLHAVLEREAEHWTVSDDGLSRNGTYVNGERVTERRALGEGDVLRLGLTQLVYHLPPTKTRRAADRPAPSLTDIQRQILVALCRPRKEEGPSAPPATNRQIAKEVFLGVETVKAHLRVLYKRFEVEPLLHGHKRARLADRALESGLV